MEKTEIKGFTNETIGIICNKLMKISIEYEKLKIENKALKKQLTLTGVSRQREQFDKFYKWLDDMSQAEYDEMSLTEKCEKFFFGK